jgi:hypothetical protein
MLRLIIVLVIIYVGFLVVLALTQNKLTYFPTNYPEPDLTEMAGTQGLSAWRNSEGNLIGWRRAARPGEAVGGPASHSPGADSTITDGSRPFNRAIVFHGNGGMALGRPTFSMDWRTCRPVSGKSICSSIRVTARDPAGTPKRRSWPPPPTRSGSFSRRIRPPRCIYWENPSGPESPVTSRHGTRKT